jgi:hypothetical protein
MKFPTLTAITLAVALAAVPALARDDAASAAKTPDTTAAVTPGTTTAAVTTTTPEPGSNAAAPAVTAETNATNPAANLGTATVNSKDNRADKDSANANALPHERNPVLADNCRPRASKVIGSTVYNMQDKKIGTVDDILMGENGQPDQAVLSVKGKLVAMPFNQLVFGNTKVNSDNRVILPDETASALNTLPEFHYRANNKG